MRRAECQMDRLSHLRFYLQDNYNNNTLIHIMIKLIKFSVVLLFIIVTQSISSASIPLKLNVSTEVDYVLSGKKTTGNIFDIWGRQVSAPLKGVLYIRAGKKVLFY